MANPNLAARRSWLKWAISVLKWSEGDGERTAIVTDRVIPLTVEWSRGCGVFPTLQHRFSDLK
jgi:hypothetical protein